MENIYAVLSGLGMDEKEIRVYATLLKTGPLSVRRLALEAGLNRGTAYDSLKELHKRGLVAFFNKDKKNYFIAEDPDKLYALLNKKQEEFKVLASDFDSLVPELKSLYNSGGEKPVVRIYEGEDGVYEVLNDVLNVMGKNDEKEYYVYSPEEVRPTLYRCFEGFKKERVARGISVKTIALGSGGELAGLDERKWIKESSIEHPTYTLIYSGRVAYISFDNTGTPVGAIIDNKGIYEMQKFLFLQLWGMMK